MKNKIVTLVGPSGSGKTELANFLVAAKRRARKRRKKKNHGADAAKLRTATTRTPRVGEVDGVHYDFLEVAEFERMIANEEFVEFTNYAGNYYGLPKKTVEKMLAEYPLVVAVMDIEGARSLKRCFGDQVVTVFLRVSPETIKQRMIDRGDDPSKVQERVAHAQAKREFDNGQFCDYIVDNDGDLQDTVKALYRIIGKE